MSLFNISIRKAGEYNLAVSGLGVMLSSYPKQVITHESTFVEIIPLRQKEWNFPFQSSNQNLLFTIHD